MKNILFITGVLMLYTFQYSCDGFTKPIDVDYSDHVSKGVVFSLLSNTDERDTAFRNFSSYIGEIKERYLKRIYISNSTPPGFTRNRFYGAYVDLESNDRALSLRFHEQDYQQGISEPFYSVEDVLVPGQMYHVAAEFDPDAAEQYVREWSPIAAADSMPPLTNFSIENAGLDYGPDSKGSPEGGYVNLKVVDDPARENQYLIDISAYLAEGQGGPGLSNVIHTYINRPDKETDLELFGNSRYNLFTEDDFTSDGKKRISFDFDTHFGTYDRDKPLVLLVRLTSLSNHYMRFLQSADQYSANEGNPFVEPVEIYTNVENGYGIFALAARSYGEIEVE